MVTVIADRQTDMCHPESRCVPPVDILKSLLAWCPDQLHLAQKPHGVTPLMSALSYKQPETSALLIEYGACLDIETAIWRDAPLDLASNSGMLDTARELIKRGIDIHHVGFSKRTALHWAALSGNANLILELLRHGVDPYLKDIYGYTAKDFAIQQQHKEAASVLTWWPSLYRPEQVGSHPCNDRLTSMIFVVCVRCYR